MRIYISGPISGRPENEARGQFMRAATAISAKGHTVINPWDVSRWDLSWTTYLQIFFDILASGEVDMVYMLKGWRDSAGASLERYMAIVQGITVRYEDVEDRVKYEEGGENDGE